MRGNGTSRSVATFLKFLGIAMIVIGIYIFFSSINGEWLFSNEKITHMELRKAYGTKISVEVDGADKMNYAFAAILFFPGISFLVSGLQLLSFMDYMNIDFMPKSMQPEFKQFCKSKSARGAYHQNKARNYNNQSYSSEYNRAGNVNNNGTSHMNRQDANVEKLIVLCNKCNQQLYVPRGKGRTEVNCPKCKSVFIIRT